LLLAGALHHLLETAILRSKFNIISSLTRMPAAKQLSEAQLCRLLCRALLLEIAEARRFSDIKCKWDIVLQRMVDVPGVVQELCRSSVVQQAVASADELFPLLKVAVARGNWYSAVAALCSLESAAVNITSEQLTQLLQLGMCAAAHNLEQLAALTSAVQKMPVVPLEALLLQAVQQQEEAAAAAVQCLSGAPAVRQLSRASVLQLVSAALQGSRAYCSSERPGDSLEHAELERAMLRTLFKGQMGVQAVLGPAGLAEAIKQALSMRDCLSALLLCKVEAARQIPADEAASIMHMAASRAAGAADDAKAAAMLCCLPAVQQMQPEQLQQLLTTALRGRHMLLFAQLLQLHAAQKLSGESLAALFEAGCEQRDAAAVHAVLAQLCQLPGAGHVASAAGGCLLQAALSTQQLDALTGKWYLQAVWISPSSSCHQSSIIMRAAFVGLAASMFASPQHQGEQSLSATARFCFA
jgi:hypothetical protein